MKKLAVVFFALLSLITSAQNVGIGTNTPSERLDVNGNVNIAGIVKVNGDAGRPGQMLQVNNDGSQSWANIFGYKNRKEFTFPGLTSWIVPAGVREIMIECVGGGGGGASGGGGGGGGYTIAIVKVAPGDALAVTVGTGGVGATSVGANAGFGNGSQVSGPEITIIGSGGGGGSSESSGMGGTGGANGDSVIYRRIYSGDFGTNTTENYTQLDATTFLTTRKFGNGGLCPYNPNVISTGGFYSFNSTTLAVHRVYYNNPSGNFSPGSGGGGCYFTFSTVSGLNGGGGLVAISW